MNLATNGLTHGTTLITIPAAADISTVNIEVDAVTRRLQAAKQRESVFTRFLHHSASAALRRGGTSNLK
jgi:hypothetical protein